MQIIRRAIGPVVILIMLAGCAVGTHASEAIPTLPACDKMLVGINHLTSVMDTEGRTPPNWYPGRCVFADIAGTTPKTN